MRFFIVMALFYLLGYADLLYKDSTVIDTQTHLQWQDVPANEERDEIHKLANSYCKQSHFLGFHDWRLPTKKELEDFSKKMQKKHLLHYSAQSAYWSGSDDATDDLNAWAIYLPNGHPFTEDKCEKEHFICVRTVTSTP